MVAVELDLTFLHVIPVMSESKIKVIGPLGDRTFVLFSMSHYFFYGIEVEVVENSSFFYT